jgi:hypothetical protein
MTRNIPFGHRLNGQGGLVPDPAEQEALVEARLLRAFGLSLRETAARLRGMGHRISHVALRRALGEAERGEKRCGPIGPHLSERRDRDDAAKRTTERGAMLLKVWANWPTLTIALGLALALTQPARAQGACGAIRDFERRQACIAVQDGNPAECASLRDADAKTLCRIRAEAARAQRR